ncbi:MAG: TlpA family protein disulfide reductase [Flavisolibacter sp.]|nr:TlpA family protein disulfide reductase [Flavisolibacter sp.]
MYAIISVSYLLVKLKIMNRVLKFFLFALFILPYLPLKAQTYEERYNECSQALENITREDTIYMYKVLERDKCLIGAPAPDFTRKAMQGQSIQLSKLKGQVVVLNFWSTGCIPCIEEISTLNRLVKQYAKKNVAFISVTPNNAKTLKAFFVKHPFHFTTIPESDDLRKNVFKLPSVIPYTVVIDTKGKISKLWFGNLGSDTFKFYQEAIKDALSK